MTTHEHGKESVTREPVAPTPPPEAATPARDPWAGGTADDTQTTATENITTPPSTAVDLFAPEPEPRTDVITAGGPPTEVVAMPAAGIAGGSVTGAVPDGPAAQGTLGDAAAKSGPGAVGGPGGPGMPPADKAQAPWTPPPGGSGAKARLTRSPKLVLVAAVLVTAIASSGVTAGVMSAVGGDTDATPGVTTQQQGTGQGGPGMRGGGFGGGGRPGGQSGTGTQEGTGTPDGTGSQDGTGTLPGEQTAPNSGTGT